MCSTSMTSASSSSVVPLSACSCEQRPHGVGDLAPAAVPDGDVDQHPVDVAGGLLGGLEPLGGRGGQQVERAHRVQPPARWSASESTASSMISSSGCELRGGAVEVVGREQPQGDDLDADLLAPAEQRLDVGGAGPVPVRGVARRRPWPSAGCRRASRRRAWGAGRRASGGASGPRTPGRAPAGGHASSPPRLDATGDRCPEVPTRHPQRGSRWGVGVLREASAVRSTS